MKEASKWKVIFYIHNNVMLVMSAQQKTYIIIVIVILFDRCVLHSVA